jgi:hypothetical protein
MRQADVDATGGGVGGGAKTWPADSCVRRFRTWIYCPVSHIRSYMLITLTYTSLYKISASTTEKHASALYQLVIAVQEVVIYFNISLSLTHTHTDGDDRNS